ncbi:uncharacterized protein OCT59_014322 [Rhizophagus irregularis]|uniref:uncharacterized protein n=1 Tax=Rhizophagus irregularis TaxID=588596 RepID=UPI0033208D3D|nr:hypothetical protein OCT59_014322 [Rhizophagus irregularis]
MENQKSSVNTKATTVDEINIGPIGNTQSREESSISESERPSLVRYRNLRYNILKSLDDKTNIEITEIFSTIVNYPIGQLPESNVIIQDSPLFQSSRTLALTNMMSKRRMEGVENIGTQQMGSQLRCVKCSENLSLYLPPPRLSSNLFSSSTKTSRILNLQTYHPLQLYR